MFLYFDIPQISTQKDDQLKSSFTGLATTGGTANIASAINICGRRRNHYNNRYERRRKHSVFPLL